MRQFVTVLALAGLCAMAGAVSKLQERYNWKQLDFVFPNQRLKQQALASGDYVPTNGLPVGIERWENKLFVSVPRWKDGKYRQNRVQITFVQVKKQKPKK